VGDLEEGSSPGCVVVEPPRRVGLVGGGGAEKAPTGQGEWGREETEVPEG
jgi:hypothetical protein